MVETLNRAANRGSVSTTYEIDNSIRLEAADPEELHYTTSSSSSDHDKGTFAFWMKKGERGHFSPMQINEFAAPYHAGMYFQTGSGNLADRLFMDHKDNTSNWTSWMRQFRDHSAWYHFVIRVDTTLATADDRIQLWINGVRETTFNTLDSYNSPPSQNDAHFWFDTGRKMTIGGVSSGSGYFADYHYIDGQSVAPSEFGEFDEDSGIWKPKKYGGSFGNNGFKLEFKETGTSANSSGIGADTSGNDNHMSVTNLAATDVTTDTPTNNFCTLNPLHKSSSDVVLSEGNLKMVSGYSSGWQHCAATIAVKNGKWYWEAKALAVAATDKTSIGVFQFDTTDVDFINNTNTDRSSKGISGHGAGTGSYTYAQGDIIMCGMDLDNNKVYWGKNGTWFGTLDPAAGSGSTTQTISNANFCVPAVGGYDDSSWELNFGVPQFSISSGNADANGYGNFEYAVPSGYFALCTKNLAEYG